MAVIQSGSGSDLVDVTPLKEMKVALAANANDSGYTSLAGMIDSGVRSGVRKAKDIGASTSGALKVGSYNYNFHYEFTSSGQETGALRLVNTTHTSTFSVTGFQMNSGNSQAINTGICISTRKQFEVKKNEAQELSFEIFLNAVTVVTGQEFCLGYFTGTTAGITLPGDGIYFKITNAGLAAVWNNGAGIETSTGVLLSLVNIPTNTNFRLGIHLEEEEIRFSFNGEFFSDTLVPGEGTVSFNPILTLPISIQERNFTALASVPCVMTVKSFHVASFEHSETLDAVTKQALNGFNASHGVKGMTQGSTAFLANGLIPTTGVLTNTTASANNLGLGGLFAVTPTLAANTNGILCSFQNPVGTVNLTAHTLAIYGVEISGTVTTVLANATASVYLYTAHYGHTALSLATAEAASTKTPRNVALGTSSFPINTASGTSVDKVSCRWTVPIIVYPGEFFAISMKCLNVVPVSGVITIAVGVDSLWIV